MRIAKRPFITSTIENHVIEWLVDTGASITCLSEELFRLFPESMVQKLTLPPELSIQTASGTLFDIYGRYILPINIGRTTYRQEVIIIRNLAAKAILGSDFLQRANVEIIATKNSYTINFRKRRADENTHSVEATQEVFAAESCKIPPRAIRWVRCSSEAKGLGYVESEYLAMSAALMHLDNRSFRVQIHNSTDVDLHLTRKMHVGVFSAVAQEDLIPLNKLTRAPSQHPPAMSAAKKATIDREKQVQGSPTFLRALQQLMYEFSDIISESPADLGHTNEVQHEIRMKTKEPVHIPQFRIPEEHLDILNKHVDDLLASGCIMRSSSTFNSPIFLIKKPHGNGLRVIQDFRAINEASYDNKYSIKEIQECIDNIGRMKSTTFSTLDLTSGFWQMALKKSSQDQTAFSVPGRGRFCWLVTPMGLKGSPASFQRLMDTVMEGLPNTQTYIDDCLIHSQDEVRHLVHIRECFVRLRKYNLKLNLKKCAFGRKSVPYLGHVLTADGIKPSDDKLKAVRDFPEPTSVRQVREFCGLTNYFRQHIKNFSMLAGLLTRLTRKDSEWTAGPLPAPAKAAFLRLKEQLCTAPMLAYPIRERPYLLAVDAATGTDETPGGMGAILSQIDPRDGLERVVSYASRSLKDFEKNYTPFLLEKAAAVWGIDHFHHYLYGRIFSLLTDHRPVEKMTKLHQKTLNRLQQQQNKYNFTVMYRQGELNGGPDALSRNPVDSVGASLEQIIEAQNENRFCKMLIDNLKTKFLPHRLQDIKDVTCNGAELRTNRERIALHLQKKRFPRQITPVCSRCFQNPAGTCMPRNKVCRTCRHFQDDSTPAGEIFLAWNDDRCRQIRG